MIVERERGYVNCIVDDIEAKEARESVYIVCVLGIDVCEIWSLCHN